MAGKKRCFLTVRALKRLDEGLLCAVLGKFPAYRQACGLVLPDPPVRSALDDDKIRDACMGGEVPDDLDEVLFLVSTLGSKRGQAQIEREAQAQGRRLDFRIEGLSCADFAMKAWLFEWPANRDLLESAYARARLEDYFAN